MALTQGYQGISRLKKVERRRCFALLESGMETGPVGHPLGAVVVPCGPHWRVHAAQGWRGRENRPARHMGRRRGVFATGSARAPSVGVANG
jgi:hypothetical protein